MLLLQQRPIVIFAIAFLVVYQLYYSSTFFGIGPLVDCTNGGKHSCEEYPFIITSASLPSSSGSSLAVADRRGSPPVQKVLSISTTSSRNGSQHRHHDRHHHHHHVPLLNLSSSVSTSEMSSLKCGMNWTDFLALQDSWKEIYKIQVSQQAKKDREAVGLSGDTLTMSSTSSSSPPLVPLLWTVSGGEKYSVYLPMILKRWQRLGMYPTLVMALDVYTADLICSTSKEELLDSNNGNDHRAGHFAILWDQPKASYSIVSDVKFEVPAVMVDAGIPSFFLEPDIFCRRSPIPTFLQEIAFNSSDDQVMHFQPNNDTLHNRQSFDLIHTGAYPENWYPNIGAYLVLPNPQVAKFFRNVRAILEYSTNAKRFSSTVHGKQNIGFFDQAIYHLCLPERSYERGGRLYTRMYQNQSDFDLSQLCQRNQTSFRYKALSNEIMGYAPQITENTHCIHPLLGRPGQAFEGKLLFARYYGFEPDIDIWEDGKEKFIRFYSGDLTTAACYDRAYPHKKLSSKSQKDVVVFRFQYQLSALIALAIRTNRTVVLPRNVRTRQGDAVQLPILVSVLSIEKLVKYRFDIPKPLLDQEDGMLRPEVQSVFMARDDLPFQDTVRVLQEEAHSQSTVIALERACLLVKEEDYKMAVSTNSTTDVMNNLTRNEVLHVMSQINWCIGKRDFTFYEGQHGPHDKYCEDFYVVKTQGVTW